jgi:hypothetical protein
MGFPSSPRLDALVPFPRRAAILDFGGRMPTRILREGIISSERVNSLSERAELFFRKVMSVADDYGRFYANPISLLGACYPLRTNVCEADVKQFLSECISANVIMVYGGGKYLAIHNFKQQTRSVSKFPEPTVNESLIKCKADDKQMCRVVVGGDEGEVVSEGASKVGLDIFKILENRVGFMFSRPANSPAIYSEQSMISEISRRPDVIQELEIIERLKGKPDNWFPQSVEKLLQNWQSTLDKARNYESRTKTNGKNHPQRVDRSIGTANEGIASKYKGLGRVAEIQDKGQSGTGSNGG